MFFCLTQKPHPVRRPPLCRRGAGGEAVPRERENQINTLVLKDINFTINIIELFYYRTIDTLNQPKNAPVVLPPQAPPKEGMSLIPSHISSCFKLYPIRTSPPSEGLGEASFGVGLLPCYWSILFFILLFFWFGVGGEAFLFLPSWIIH